MRVVIDQNGAVIHDDKAKNDASKNKSNANLFQLTAAPSGPVAIAEFKQDCSGGVVGQGPTGPRMAKEETPKNEIENNTSMDKLRRLVGGMLVELSRDNVPGVLAAESKVNEHLAQNQDTLGEDTVVKVLELIFLKNKF